MKSQKVEKAENIADTVKTKQNYIKATKNAEMKDGVKQKQSVSMPKTRENTSASSATPKTKEQAIKDARKKYVSEKLKTRAETEKAVRENEFTKAKYRTHKVGKCGRNGFFLKVNAENKGKLYALSKDKYG